MPMLFPNTEHRFSRFEAHIEFIKRVGKSEKCEACLAFYRFFGMSLIDKFNDTGAQMLDSIYHMTQKIFEIMFLAWKRPDFAIFTKR